MVASVLVLAPVADADSSWPRPIEYGVVRGPEANATGNTWCVRQRRGSYGSAHFMHTESWVDDGGSCNAMWGRPSGDLRAQTVSYTFGGSILRNSLEQSSAWNAHTVQADIPYVPANPNLPASGAFNHLAQTRSYNGWLWQTASRWEAP